MIHFETVTKLFATKQAQAILQAEKHFTLSLAGEPGHWIRCPLVREPYVTTCDKVQTDPFALSE
jgi:hypothetical protein